mmetsp:Transcript_28944/g.92534  ORF Transcript_28944/g.92534 Transcript_28944/m.92534 type:complete len:953 (-) Transcript_28944:232-3090(-)
MEASSERALSACPSLRLKRTQGVGGWEFRVGVNGWAKLCLVPVLLVAGGELHVLLGRRDLGVLGLAAGAVPHGHGTHVLVDDRHVAALGLLVAHEEQAEAGAAAHDPGHGLEHRDEGGAAAALAVDLGVALRVALAVGADPAVPALLHSVVRILVVVEQPQVVVHVPVEVRVVALEVVVLEVAHRKVALAHGAAVVAVRAHRAHARAARVVALVVVVPDAAVVAAVAGGHQAAAVRAVRARLAEHRRAAAGVVIVVAAPVVEVVVVEKFAAIVEAVLVAMAVVRPVAAVLAHVVVVVRVDDGDRDGLGQVENACAVVHAGDNHVQGLARGHVAPPAVGLEGHLQRDEVLDGGFKGRSERRLDVHGGVLVDAGEGAVEVEGLGVASVDVLHALHLDARLGEDLGHGDALLAGELDAVDGHEHHELLLLRIEPGLALLQTQRDGVRGHGRDIVAVRGHAALRGEVERGHARREIFAHDYHRRAGRVEALVAGALRHADAALVHLGVADDGGDLHVHGDRAGAGVHRAHEERARVLAPLSAEKVHLRLLRALDGEAVAIGVDGRVELDGGGAVPEHHEPLTEDAESVGLGHAQLGATLAHQGALVHAAHDLSLVGGAYGLHLAVLVGDGHDAQVPGEAAAGAAPELARHELEHELLGRRGRGVNGVVLVLRDGAAEAHAHVAGGGEVGAPDVEDLLVPVEQRVRVGVHDDVAAAVDDVGEGDGIIAGGSHAQLAGAGVDVREDERALRGAPDLAIIEAQVHRARVDDLHAVVDALRELEAVILLGESQLERLLLERLALEHDHRLVLGGVGRRRDVHVGGGDHRGDLDGGVGGHQGGAIDGEAREVDGDALAVLVGLGPLRGARLGERDAEVHPCRLLDGCGELYVAGGAVELHVDEVVHGAVRPGLLPARAVDAERVAHIGVERLGAAYDLHGVGGRGHGGKDEGPPHDHCGCG